MNNGVVVEKNKKSILALIAMILGILYLIYIISYFGNGVLSKDSSEAIGAGIASFLVLPHVLFSFLAVLFNALGFFLNKRGFVLTGGILYIVALVLFVPYFMFVIIQAVLCFIAYAKMKK